MTRYHFLKSLGFTGAALMAAMTSCIREEDTVIDEALTLPGTQATTPTTSGSGTSTTPGTGTTTTPTVDLSKITNRLLTITLSTSALKTVGGYVTQSGIVVAQVSAGVYVAVTQTCSHEPRKNVVFNKTEFYCTVHGARFDLTGKGKNSLGSRGLTVYKTATDGTTLVVYS
jgi:nitrite reductase/ring-hydroxylating ferredoxin subunit